MTIRGDIGRYSRQRGYDNENAVVCALLRFPPPWMFDARLSTEFEDSNGIDVVAETWFGDLPIQVKSSGRRIDRHVRRYSYIPYVVVYRWDREKAIAKKAVKAMLWYLTEVVGVCPVLWGESR